MSAALFLGHPIQIAEDENRSRKPHHSKAFSDKLLFNSVVEVHGPNSRYQIDSIPLALGEEINEPLLIDWCDTLANGAGCSDGVNVRQ